MGRDKLLLPFGSGTLLQRVVGRLRLAVDYVFLVGDHALPDTDTVPDDSPGRGPLSALATALRYSPCPRLFVCGGDMPFIDPSIVGTMLAMPGDMVALNLERLQPLHAVYAISGLPSIEGLLQSGEQRLTAVFDCLPVTWADALPHAHRSCSSLNTLDEYQQALQSL